MTEEKRPQLIPSLTGIRGIACLSIVCYHFFCLYVDDRGLDVSMLPFFPASEFFFAYSKNAVELFFMISGFLTAYHYRDRIASMPAWEYFKKHYRKLIVPSVIVNLWALGNALITLRTVPGSEEIISPITPVRIVLSVLMVNTGWVASPAQTMLPINTTMWYIDVLLLCYLLYYPIRRLVGSRAPYVALCLAMVALGWVCLEHTPKLPFLWALDGRGYAPFFVGVLLCELRESVGERTLRVVSAVWAALIVGLLAVRCVVGFESMFGEMGGSAYVRYFEFFVAPGLLLAALSLKPVRGLLELKPLVWLGGLSAAIYYVHNSVMEDYLIINSVTGNQVDLLSPLVFVLIIASVVPIAVVWRCAGRNLSRFVRSRLQEAAE